MRRSTAALGGLVGLLVVAAVLVWTGVWVQALDPGPYDRTTVTVVDENGSELGRVDARIAEAWDERIVGLSRTETLGNDEGMVFVHDDEKRHTYVMRDMSIPLDIVFVAANGTITRIHHADVPADGTSENDLEKYRGVGKYVLEVERGWTNETGASVGDRVLIPDGTTAESPEPNESDRETVTDGGTPSATTTMTDEPPGITDPSAPVVTAVDENGSELGNVSVVIADNSSERYTGLSDTEHLAWDEGMLFVFEEEGTHTFVMRRMDFPLDMIFVAANGTVTRIHHAPVPPEETTGEDLTGYPGTGKYVLEVNRGWANETGLDVGDVVRIPDLD